MFKTIILNQIAVILELAALQPQNEISEKETYMYLALTNIHIEKI